MSEDLSLPLLAQSTFAEDGDTALLKAPRNVTTKRIFVAATRMNEGKTTVCLGLFAALRSISPSVGYIKPIGQRFVEVQGSKIDEYSLLLDSILMWKSPLRPLAPWRWTLHSRAAIC
jgi:hypothetical protein